MNTPVHRGNQRINEHLLEYWSAKKGTRPFPTEGDIDPEEIADIWTACFLVRADDAGRTTYQYTYLGAALIEAYGDDLTNQDICEKLVNPNSMSLVHKFDEVCKTKQPVEEESEFTNSKGMLIKFRSCMVPLGKDNSNNVAFILGGMKWKAF